MSSEKQALVTDEEILRESRRYLTGIGVWAGSSVLGQPVMEFARAIAALAAERQRELDAKRLDGLCNTLPWSIEATEYDKTLVIGNLRNAAAILRGSHE